mmetsp:Transcript_21003/g.30315  ORF Transcript_21003/g.30315 Transcript_21003/m.30315 type:complete len:301 (+) Transcript_21003:120-1022(+)
MDHSSLEIKLNKFDRVYRPNSKVDGTVVVNAYKGWQHVGLKMTVEGKIYLNSTARGVGILDSMNANKPISIYREETELVPPGKFVDGSTDVPFQFVLTGQSGEPLIESYHGVYVSVIYSICVSCPRGVMKKGLIKEMEFIVEIPSGRSPDPSPVTFSISPESLENVHAEDLVKIPKFKISGKLHRSNCPVNLPFTGEVIIELCEAPIRSIELQLVRVETVMGEQSPTREATEIQSIQIGEGNVYRNMVVPMYMVFPRLFSCPTVSNSLFKLDFEVNLIVIFGDGYMVTENFPITLFRENN